EHRGQPRVRLTENDGVGPGAAAEVEQAPAAAQVQPRGQGGGQAQRVGVQAAQQQFCAERVRVKDGVLRGVGTAADRVFQPAPQLPAVGVEERYVAAKGRLAAV